MADQQNELGQKRALVIGISDYTNPDFRPLDFCKNDGTGIYEILQSPECNFSENKMLVGKVNGDDLRDAMNRFFSNTTVDGKRIIRADDTLVFYYSGHGVLDAGGDLYLASSDIDPDEPYLLGFSFKDMIKRIRYCKSTKVVAILDCCYSGSVGLGKGDEEAAAKLGTKAMDENSRSLPPEQGKYILSASQAAQEAFGNKKDMLSIFTSFVLEGLKGSAIDDQGNVTPLSLAKFIFRKMSANKRLKQTPVMRTEESGDVILASYPELIQKAVRPVPTTTSSSTEINIKQKQSEYQFLGWNRRQLLIPAIVAVVSSVIILILIPGFTDLLQKNDPAFKYGSLAAMSDIRNGSSFNPACDPTGAHASGDQHPTAFCTAWTRGYIDSWNAQHPGYTNGFISGWQPSNAPANGSTISSCQQCATRLKPIIRYINGTTDGGQAATSDIRENKQFDPACDPTRSHTSDGLHTTEYCNGWTNGYISTWNAKHSNIPNSLSPNSKTCKKEPDDSLVCTSKYKYVNGQWTQIS